MAQGVHLGEVALPRPIKVQVYGEKSVKNHNPQPGGGFGGIAMGTKDKC